MQAWSIERSFNENTMQILLMPTITTDSSFQTAALAKEQL